MIVNLRNTESFKALRNVLRRLTIFWYARKYYREQLKQAQDSKQLYASFYNKYPALTKNNLNNSLCISCSLCSEICPPKVIKIERPNLVNFPDSLKTGEAPSHFFIDISDCTKCGLCAQVCPVDALELTENYIGLSKIDLVQESLN